jgi:hypothetical protein
VQREAAQFGDRSVSGKGSKVFLTGAAQFDRLTRWNAQSGNLYSVLMSGGLSDGVVVCIAVNALVSAFNAEPRFELASEGTIINDTNPNTNLDTSAVATQNPKCLFQTDSLGLRMTLEGSWALRSSSGLAWLSGVAW